MSKSIEVKDNGTTSGLLGIVFVTLKLLGVIDWSWWFVTMPFWGGLAIALTVLVGCAITWIVATITLKVLSK